MRASVVALLVLSACKFEPLPALDDADGGIDAASDGDVPVEPRVVYASRVDQTALDVLFVIDDSGSMQDEQVALASAFPALLERLEAAGRPSLHLGVVTPDLGTAPFNLSNCDDDRGILQGTPLSTTCTGPTPEPYLRDEPDGAGGRVTNYTGTLAESLSCIAQRGIQGCGFEQHLGAIERAISTATTENAGFVRDDAKLAVVILADEDDCSVSDPAMFDTGQNGDDTELGYLSSFRCTEFGVTCAEGAIARGPGVYTACESRDDSPYLPHPREYAAALIDRKGPGSVFAAAIVAPGDGFEVEASPNENIPGWQVADVCGAPSSNAIPAIRFQDFLDELPGRAARYSICGTDYTDEMAELGERLASISGGPICLGGSIPEPGTCRVHDVTGFDTGAESRTEIPACDGSNAPCFELAPRQSTCPRSDHHLLLEVDRTATPPAGTVLVVECE